MEGAYAPGDVTNPELFVVGAGNQTALEEDRDAILGGEMRVQWFERF